MKKILIVTPDADGRVGGAERFAHLLTDALSLRYQVEMLPTPDLPSRRPAAASWLRKSSATAALVREFDPDLVITGVTSGWRFSPHIPRIHVCHGTMVHNARAALGEPSKARLSAALGGGAAEFLAMRRAHLVAVSRATVDDLRTDYLVRGPIEVIENGVDTTVFRPRPRADARAALGWSSSARIALFVGRPELRKGIDVAVAATRASGHELVIAGSRGVDGARWLGLLAPDQLALAYAASDAVVFPTRYEACSYTVLEAIASGARLLTTRVGWMKDAAQRIPGLDRLLVEAQVPAFTRELRAEADAPGQEPLREALRAHVLRHNSLGVFVNSWNARVEQTLR